MPGVPVNEALRAVVADCQSTVFTHCVIGDASVGECVTPAGGPCDDSAKQYCASRVCNPDGGCAP